MKKIFGFVFLIVFFLACRNGTEKDIDEENKKQKPTLKKLEVLNITDSSSIKVFEIFASNVIGGIETEEEKVKINITVDKDISIKYTPDLQDDVFVLNKIGNNTLNITLEKQGLQNVYILTIKRKSKTIDLREIRELKFTTDYVANYAMATVVNRSANDDKLFELQLPHIASERRYFIFVEGKETSDIVLIEGKTKPYPKANKTKIEIGNLAKAGGETTLDFYLFKDGVDTNNIGLGTKYTLKVGIKKEPNTTVKSIRFNGEKGNIDGNLITCDYEFDINTDITTSMELEVSTSTFIVNKGNPVKIAGNGARFDIYVIPEEGYDFKSTYHVTLKAKANLTKKITGIKYLDGGPVGSVDDLVSMSNRNLDNICLVEYSDGNNFTFSPIPNEDIRIIEKEVWGSYSTVSENNNIFVIQARDLKTIDTGIKIRVTFKDDSTDEFIIRKN